ncbi:MAG: GNAT family N-acetyltransferase, partial [Acidimicrobiia bacterium]|nr:GNAT family N-acetyltransferase [Acidimicrobiia bacterium]
LVAVATFAVLGILVMDTYIADETLDLLGRLISIAYPVMDVALLAVAARLATSVHLHNRSYALMAAGVMSLLVADFIYGILNSAGAFETGGFADAFWIGFYALVGAAALHPAMATPTRTRPPQPGRITMTRLGVLCLVTLTVPVIDLAWGEPFDKVLTTTASMAMFLLVLGRLMGLMRTIKESEAQARHDATHDALTGLANRVLFAEKVEQLLEKNTSVTAVLFVDLDDFKTINDSLGHHMGDELLIEAASRLSSCVRPTDTVARLGGDEFAVVLAGAVDRQDAVATAHRVLEVMSEPISLDGKDVMVSASVGIAIGNEGEGTADLLLRGADAAMYLAKEKGKGRFEFFEQEMHSEAVERLDLRRDLQLALQRGELEIYYQPIMDLTVNKVTMVEALLRWNHPERGLVPPDKFIGLAEQTGLIVPIGRWVLEQACLQVKEWQQSAPGGRLGVSVNLSVRQLHNKGLLEDVAEALRLSRLDPQCLTLEITESMLIEDTARGARALEQLKALKVRIAIDDFGTGYSSLSYLRQFPFDTIKIDRSFVSELDRSTTSEALVRTVIELARSLNMSTVAEGIEELTQWTALSNLACQLGQGFFFSKPLNATAMHALLVKSATEAVDERPAEASRRPSRTTRRLEPEVHEGRDALLMLRADLDELHTATATPLTARMTWLQAWADVHDDYHPVVVLVRERGRGRIDGAALLARRETGGSAELVALGHGSAGSTRFAVRAPRAARALARAMANQLQNAETSWIANFAQLPENDLVAKLLLQHLPNAELVSELAVPRLVFGPAEDVDHFLSKNLRRQLRKAQNRLEVDGIESHLEFRSRFDDLEHLLDEMEAVHVERDHASGRDSDLDDPHVRRQWRALVRAHGRAGMLEVATLRFDHQLAGFVIAMVDGPVYRVFDGHFDTGFARYSPGRMVETAAVARALADDRFTEVDWMSGIASEKILSSNAAEPRARLVASSVVLTPADTALLSVGAGSEAD